jgi:hypothetical protein
MFQSKRETYFFAAAELFNEGNVNPYRAGLQFRPIAWGFAAI